MDIQNTPAKEFFTEDYIFKKLLDLVEHGCSQSIQLGALRTAVQYIGMFSDKRGAPKVEVDFE